MIRVSRFLAPKQATPRTPTFPLEWRFSGVGAEALQARPPDGALMPVVRRGSEAVDVDRRHVFG